MLQYYCNKCDTVLGLIIFGEDCLKIHLPSGYMHQLRDILEDLILRCNVYCRGSKRSIIVESIRSACCLHNDHMVGSRFITTSCSTLLFGTVRCLQPYVPQLRT